MKLARFAALLAIALSAPGAGNAAPSTPGHLAGSQPDGGEALASAERMARWQLGALPHPVADGGALPPNLDPALAQFIRNESAANPRSWHQGAFWLGMSRLADRSGAAWVKEAILAHGRSQHWRLGERTYNADDHLIGMTYLWASRNGEGGRALAPLRASFDSILQAPPRARLSLYLGSEGMRGYYKAECLQRWCWSDALFMAPATWIGLSRATGDARYRDFALAEFWASANFLYDPAERLYFRDSRFFAERDEQGRKIFWSRGNGWVLAGLALMLEELPARDPARRRLVAHFREFAQGIAQRQRPEQFRTNLKPYCPLLAGRAAKFTVMKCSTISLICSVDIPSRSRPSSISNTEASNLPETRMRASSSEVFTISAAAASTKRTCAAANCDLTISLKDRVGLASASMPIFIQNSACALMDRHITALALRTSSCTRHQSSRCPCPPFTSIETTVRKCSVCSGVNPAVMNKRLVLGRPRQGLATSFGRLPTVWSKTDERPVSSGAAVVERRGSRLIVMVVAFFLIRPIFGGLTSHATDFFGLLTLPPFVPF